MILTASLACAVVVYHEARSTTFKEQYYVASTIYNRATAQNKNMVDVIYQPHQYSGLNGFKKRLKFNNYNSFEQYYKLNDKNSLYIAITACDYAKQNNNGLIFYHDKRICHMPFKTNKPTIITRNFKFYRL